MHVIGEPLQLPESTSHVRGVSAPTKPGAHVQVYVAWAFGFGLGLLGFGTMTGLTAFRAAGGEHGRHCVKVPDHTFQSPHVRVDGPVGE